MHVRLKELGRRSWRLLWLGGIQRPSHDATGLTVEVVFVEDPIPRSGRPYWKPLFRPVEELPLYGVQSAWKDGICQDYDDREHPLRCLHVKPGSARYAATVAAKSPAFSEADYPLFGKYNTASCWVFDTEEGIELVVPGWQILQAWYLCEPELTSAVLAGHLDVNIDYATRMPWRPGTRCTKGHAEYHLPRGMSVSAAKRFSRLLFDPYARDQAMSIWNKLLAGPRSHLPMVRPPHIEAAPWTFRMKQLATVNGKERWLLLHLHSARIPLPYSTFTAVEVISPPSEPEDAPPIIVRSADAAGPNDGLPLVGGRSGRRRGELHRVHGLSFLDSEVEAVPVQTRQEVSDPISRVTALVLPDPEQPVEAASMTTEGAKDAKVVAVQPATPSKPAEDPSILFERSRAAFDAVVAYVAANPLQGPGWSARCLTEVAHDSFLLRGRDAREFVILELRVGATYTYAVDVLRQPEDGEFPLAMARRIGAGPLERTHLAVWLRRFPFSGPRPWGSEGEIPAWLYRPVAIRHQTTELPSEIQALPADQRAPAAEAHWLRLFRDRLLRFLMQFERVAQNKRAPAKRRTAIGS